MRRQILVLAVVFVYIWAACTQAAIEYEVIDLGTLGGDTSCAFSINDVGQIVGYESTQIAEHVSYASAVLFDSTGDGDNIRLSGPAGGVARAINNSGQIVGITGDSENNWRATLFDPTGAGNNIHLGGGVYSQAYSINEVGQVVGWVKYTPSPSPRYATLFDNTGSGNNIDLGVHGVAESINNNGQIVGHSGSRGHPYRAILIDPKNNWSNIDLGTLDGDQSYAHSINDAGQIVGDATNANGDSRATLFDPTGSGNNIDLNTLIDPNSGWTLLEARDINNSGRIVGQGINPGGKTHAFLLVPISTKYSGGTGEPDDPYQIATAADLIGLGETPADYDKHFILTADIDLDPNLPGRKVFDRAVIAPDVNDGNYDEWVGNAIFDGMPFTGVFDGNDHIITNADVNMSGIEFAGLFGHLGIGGQIRNLGVQDISVVGSAHVGGLVGSNSGDISNCYSVGLVTGTRHVGGLVGRNKGSIINCYSSGSVTGTVTGSSGVGGLVGENYRGSITESYSASTVAGDRGLGGLVGENWRYGKSATYGPVGVDGLVGENYRGSITESYSTGSVTGSSDVGGLVGDNFGGSVQTSSAAGTVTGNENVGGLVGLMHYGSVITSYSTSPVNGETIVGGLVGENNSGNIIESYSTGTVIGDPLVGGLVGRNVVHPGSRVGFEQVLVAMSYSTGTVNGTNLVGGLVGVNVGTITASYSTGIVNGTGGSVGGLVGSNSGDISNCCSTGSVTGTSDVGGLVGSNDFNISIINCYSSGSVTGTGDDVGGLVGNNPYGTVSESFWDVNTSGCQTSAGGAGKTTAEMQDAYTFFEAGWDFVAETANGTCNFWLMPEGGGYPVLATFSGYIPPEPPGGGTAEDPYLISDANELGTIWYRPSACYVMTEDIDLGGIGWSGPVVPFFSGVFDGDDHIIRNASVNMPAGDNVGVFGSLETGGQIRNLGVENISVLGDDNVGGLVGRSYGTIINCHSTGAVEGYWCVGGLVGLNYRGTVINCYSTGSVTGDGLVGGLAGENYDGSIINCYSTASSTGTGNQVGGLVGDNGRGDIISCYATGSVAGDGLVGGLVGCNKGGDIINCYSTGSVAGDRLVGGLVGYKSYGTISASFWDAENSGLSTSDGGAPLTTTEMQAASTFFDAGWDFIGETENGTDDIWWIDEGNDYPRLWWEADSN